MDRKAKMQLLEQRLMGGAEGLKNSPSQSIKSPEPSAPTEIMTSGDVNRAQAPSPRLISDENSKLEPKQLTNDYMEISPPIDAAAILEDYQENSNSDFKRKVIDVDDESKSKRLKESEPDGGSRGAAEKGMRKIESYFQQDAATAEEKPKNRFFTKKAPPAANAPTTARPATTSPDTSIPNGSDKQIVEMRKQMEAMRQAKELAEHKLQRIEAELKLSSEKYRALEERNAKLTKYVEDVARSMAQQEARRKRDRLAADCVRLGKITTTRTGPTSVADLWEEGYALKELEKRVNELAERKDELEKRRKKLGSLKRVAKKNTVADDEETGLGDGALVDFDLLAEENVVKTHLEQLRRDENNLMEERRLLESEKALHQKELKRCMHEDYSKFFATLPCLNNRYVLLNLLGKGGFSEVWRSLDLVELSYVAVKIHQLNTNWSEERKHGYIRHVTREYTIHRDMMHPRVVQLYDVFEIDVNSFATVLEYCRGVDLDEKLKSSRTIPEKDAKSILMQIVSGLKYLNNPNVYHMETTHHPGEMEAPSVLPSYQSRKRSIIHFDLKPANILFDEHGDAKITDFGLSKIVDEVEGSSMELTSQGAGTYWYLPPECFSTPGQTPRISNKVDVWSVGVIYYQMLFGKRPFGEGKSQESVLAEGIMWKATQVDFPADTKVKVSDEAKEFIRVCLTWDQRYRPDVMTLCQHNYLRNVQKKA